MTFKKIIESATPDLNFMESALPIMLGVLPSLPNIMGRGLTIPWCVILMDVRKIRMTYEVICNMSKNLQYDFNFFHK
jgi:hypothetical protein